MIKMERYERQSNIPRGPAFGYLPAPKMPHIGHAKHLCYLAESGDCTLEEIKALVKDAKFVCKKCGRAAAAEENLCEPVPL
jgi:hypothetical protein